MDHGQRTTPIAWAGYWVHFRQTPASAFADPGAKGARSQFQFQRVSDLRGPTSTVNGYRRPRGVEKFRAPGQFRLRSSAAIDPDLLRFVSQMERIRFGIARADPDYGMSPKIVLKRSMQRRKPFSKFPSPA